MEFVPHTEDPSLGKILCCMCGVAIEPNAANTCLSCIRAKVDITEGLPRQSALLKCKFCERYLQPPDAWLKAQPESKELLAICIKKLKTGLSKVRLTDAGFIWTEPHSKRLKVKLTIQKEVMGGAILQQTVPVEFVVQGQMCDDCRRVEAKDYWRACVQIRQKCDHKKTLFYLEQLVLKHKAHITTTGVAPTLGGIDFFYARLQGARKLVEFVERLLPVRVHTAQELVSHDTHNNVYDYKNTIAVEIVPVCKDAVVCLSKKMANSLGNLGQICIVLRISQNVHLIDPQTLAIAEVSSAVYWRDPFYSLCPQKNMVEYTVIDIDVNHNAHKNAGQGHISNKHKLADAWVMRSSELGLSNAQQYSARTHLGHILQPGDAVMGVDLVNSNVNDDNFEKMRKDKVPDVVLVKKVYNRTIRQKRRNWKLRRMAEGLMDTESVENDFNEFLDDLEEDPLQRQHVNIYKRGPPPMAVEASEEDSETMPAISLQEMLDDLDLDDHEMAEDDEHEEEMNPDDP